MKIRKAIIPAAGLGTRFLPATKAMPKEMLPIVDKRPRPHLPPNTKARFLTEEENFADMIKWMRELVPPEMQHLLESTPEIQITPEDEERLASMSPQEAQRERDALQRLETFGVDAVVVGEQDTHQAASIFSSPPI